MHQVSTASHILNILWHELAISTAKLPDKASTDGHIFRNNYPSLFLAKNDDKKMHCWVGCPLHYYSKPVNCGIPFQMLARCWTTRKWDKETTNLLVSCISERSDMCWIYLFSWYLFAAYRRVIGSITQRGGNPHDWLTNYRGRQKVIMMM